MATLFSITSTRFARARILSRFSRVRRRISPRVSCGASHSSSSVTESGGGLRLGALTFTFVSWGGVCWGALRFSICCFASLSCAVSPCMVARRPASSCRRAVTISLSCSGNEDRVTCLVDEASRCCCWCCFPCTRSAHFSSVWPDVGRSLERERPLRMALRHSGVGVTERLLVVATENPEVALESR